MGRDGRKGCRAPPHILVYFASGIVEQEELTQSWCSTAGIDVTHPSATLGFADDRRQAGLERTDRHPVGGFGSPSSKRRTRVGDAPTKGNAGIWKSLRVARGALT